MQGAHNSKKGRGGKTCYRNFAEKAEFSDENSMTWLYQTFYFALPVNDRKNARFFTQSSIEACGGGQGWFSTSKNIPLFTGCSGFQVSSRLRTCSFFFLWKSETLPKKETSAAMGEDGNTKAKSLFVLKIQETRRGIVYDALFRQAQKETLHAKTNKRNKG